MAEALKLAHKAASLGEIPIGAVLVENGKIIGRAHNQREKTGSPLHHAEMRLLEKVGKKKGNWRLNDTTLYVTLEPCPMCLGALLQARVGTLVYGALDPKRTRTASFPSIEKQTALSGNNHTVEIIGPVLGEECGEILKEFFKNRR